MLEPSASISTQVAKPSVQTWSIVAHSYFRNGQRAAAEKIMQMMREQGITPDQVTWNTIISGYAGMQDAFAAVEAMKNMEQARFEVDSYTLKALTRIRDRNQLLDALRKAAAQDDNTKVGELALEDPIQATFETSLGNNTESPEQSDTTPLSHRLGSSRRPMCEAEQEAGDQATSGMTKDPGRIGRIRRVLLRQNSQAAPPYVEGTERGSYVDRDFLGPTEKPFKTPAEAAEPASQSSNGEENDFDHLYDIHDTQPGVLP